MLRSGFCVSAVSARPCSSHAVIDVAQGESLAMTTPIGVVPVPEGVACESLSLTLMWVFAFGQRRLLRLGGRASVRALVQAWLAPPYRQRLHAALMLLLLAVLARGPAMVAAVLRELRLLVSSRLIFAQ